MTGPSEAEIRDAIESKLSGWTLNVARDDFNDTKAFDRLIDGDHVTDDDYSVFSDAHTEALRDLSPAMAAALRPFLIEAQVRAAMRFFEHYPDAPRKPQLTTA